MNTNVTKLIALAIVGGVAKSLFANPRPTFNYNYPEVEAAEEKSNG